MIRSGYRNMPSHNRHHRPTSEPTQNTNTPTATAKPNTTPVKTSKKKVDGNKYMSMFNAARALGLTGAQFTKTLGILKKSGMLDKRTATALQEVFLGAAKSGSVSPQALKKLDTLGKEFSVMGRALTVLTGLFSTMMFIQKGKYPQAAAEIYKTGVGVAASGATAAKMATVNLLNTTIQAFYPNYKDSALCKFVGALDVVNLGGVAIDSIGTLFTAFEKEGGEIKKLDGLVKRMRASGAGFFVDVGESAGGNTYDIYHQVKTSGRGGWKAYVPEFIQRAVR